jgi:hypothetical protein
VTVLHEVELTPEIEGTYYSPKLQWWCAHADLVDEAGVTSSLYFWPTLGALGEAWICSLHYADRVVDMTELHLPVGTFTTSRTSVDVEHRGQYIRGTYPSYEIQVEGDDLGERFSLNITMTAESPSFQAIPEMRGITWHYVPRFAVDGVLARGETKSRLSGNGYLERRRGRFWAPGNDRGLWESIPAPASAPFTVPLFYKVWRKDESAQLQTLTFTVDGKEMIDFKEIEVDVLETISIPGFEEVNPPSRFRLVARGDEGHAELEVVRSPHRLCLRNYFDDPDPRANWAGMYGAGHTRGVITFRGQAYEVDGDSYGSSLFFF